MRDERLAGAPPWRRGDGVLEVEDHGVRSLQQPSRSGRGGRRGRTAARARARTGHGRAPSRHIRTVRVASPTTTPSWFRPVCSQRHDALTRPRRESRFVHDDGLAYSVSPWNSGCGNDTSENPRFATMVPCVSWPTECRPPSSRASTSSSRAAARTAGQLTTPRRGAAPADSSSESMNSTLSASVTVRPGPVQVAVVRLELLEVEPALLDVRSSCTLLRQRIRVPRESP